MPPTLAEYENRDANLNVIANVVASSLVFWGSMFYQTSVLIQYLVLTIAFLDLSSHCHFCILL